MKKRNGLGSSLAQDFFFSEREYDRLEKILVEKISDILGVVTDHIWFHSEEEEVAVVDQGTSLAATEEGQRKIYDLGFKRIEIIHNDASKTSYYVGGDVRGYRLS